MIELVLGISLIWGIIIFYAVQRIINEENKSDKHE
jgi:hypothetical protein